MPHPPTIEIIGAWPPESGALARWLSDMEARSYADVLSHLQASKHTADRLPDRRSP
jgi:hypothetical protein